MPNRARLRPACLSLLLAGLLGAAAAQPAAAASMTFKLQGPAQDCAACFWILAEGEIDRSTPGRFEAFLARTPDPPRLVRLNSHGGLIVYGTRLGQMIREGGFDTVVGRVKIRRGDGRAETQFSNCFSACTLAFLGGVRRRVDGGDFGIHRPAVDQARVGRAVDAEEIRQAMRLSGYLIAAYVAQMGVDPDFITRSFAGPDIRLLDHDDLVRLKVVTDGAGKPAPPG
ncbi:COG3904 family protein [Inquilinus limosus]|uniref:COG3904 family protein n=1 Tax=Inquilinus limosus TaxID=171674 RepID=UPI00068E4E9A|nr:hypothetical protein [Inquilinus limosus]